MNIIPGKGRSNTVLDVAGALRSALHPSHVDTARPIGACSEAILDGFDVKSVLARADISVITVSGTLDLELRTAR